MVPIKPDANCQPLLRPKANPTRVAELVARAKTAVRRAGSDPLAWARRLRDQEMAGEWLSPARASAWRAALGEAD